MRLPRTLDPVEIRVLGVLLEKEQATPEYYPLTVNALVAGCNQKSNREPVVSLAEDDVLQALDRLHQEVLVWPVQSARADRWRHSLERKWELDEPTRAVMTLLMLRGAQTPGELRSRSDRLHQFASTDEVLAALATLAGGSEPLVVELARRPGQKETRWMHLVGGAVEDEAQPAVPAGAAGGHTRPDRVSELEERVERLERELERLRGMLE